MNLYSFETLAFLIFLKTFNQEVFLNLSIALSCIIRKSYASMIAGVKVFSLNDVDFVDKTMRKALLLLTTGVVPYESLVGWHAEGQWPPPPLSYYHYK